MRSVVHWDGDRFFASIEQASDQRLRHRPVAVGAERRGIVVSASSEARRFGIHPGLPIRRAKRMCPTLTVVPGHFDLYEQFFRQIISLCEQTTPLVEPLTIGAAYLDLTGTRALHKQGAVPTMTQLRDTIQSWLHVSISTGIAANKTVARIASRLRKPNGSVIVAPGNEAAFLAPLPVHWLDGIASTTRDTLELAGVRTLGALARAPVDALELALGRHALQYQRRAQGIDETPVRPRDASQPQWRESFESPEEVWEEPLILRSIRLLLERILARVRLQQVEARRLTLLLRYTDREESSASLSLPHPSDLDEDFLPLLPSLLQSAWRRRVRLRALTLSVGLIYQPSAQLSLFAEPKRESGALRRLATTIDTLRRRYGEGVIHRGGRSDKL
ncbi:MAG: DNA polymerase IV [Acidobacteria bacterium]|nr:DNA polymerase IV [Acidobacteriota bacterium]